MTTTATTGTGEPQTGARSSIGGALSPVVVAEIALALVTVAAIAGFARLYRDASFFAPLAALAVAGHGLAALCRRRRVPALLTAVIAVVAGAVLIMWLFLGRTTVLGMPTPNTIDAADAAFHHAWARFGSAVAPTSVLPGFQIVAAVAVWAGIWFADWSAFRLWASAESLAPAAVLFVFGSMLGAARHRWWVTVLFAAAALGFMLLHRIARQEGAKTWVATAPGSGRRSLLRAGGALGAVALLGGAVIGPHVPGAGNRAVLSWRQGPGGNASRITVSPLVDIRKRLVDQSDVQAFSVRANRPAYWRLTSLDTFDGRIWSSGGSFSPARGKLANNGDPKIHGVRLHQDFEIDSLAAIWAPAAFHAATNDPGDNQMRWDADSATLIVDDDRNTSDGLNYAVDSVVPHFTKAELARSSASPPADVAKKYLALPSDFNRQAARLARTVTGPDDTSPYQKALRLQDWFRFTFHYSLTVPAGHSEDAIAEFLASKQGYCEQFAGTYAAMARSVGLPSRVAVGFTPGDVEPNDPELYHVKGKHAHAWPEVWFGTIGWVPFEPTPGRGAPGAQAYTGVRPEQNTAAAGPGGRTSVPGSTPRPTTPSSVPKLEPRKFNVDAGNGPAGPSHRSHRALTNPFVLAVLALLVAGVAYVLLTIGVPRARRRRARARAVTASERVALAWKETTEAVARGGSTLPFSSETHHEYAERVAPLLGPSADDHRELATLASASAWSGAAPGAAAVGRAEALSREIEAAVDQQRQGRDRVRSRLDPHRLVAPRRAERPDHSGRRDRAGRVAGRR